MTQANPFLHCSDDELDSCKYFVRQRLGHVLSAWNEWTGTAANLPVTGDAWERQCEDISSYFEDLANEIRGVLKDIDEVIQSRDWSKEVEHQRIESLVRKV